ncbi:MAG: hypothetical protein R3C18_19010 [Planctomycetaceae bacterium]
MIAVLRSSLDGANRQLPVEILSIKEVAEHPWFTLLFDPQTCGGLMLAVSPDRKDAFCPSILDSGGLATVVGTPSKPEASPILKVNF